jgi:predicted DCC family thiol-disulfide oxidoreductase YuxK
VTTSLDPVSAKSEWRFYYDGDCALCRRSVSILARLDVLKRMRWQAYQSLDAPPDGLTWADLDQQAYIWNGRHIEGGFYAFRRLSLLLPLLWSLAPLFWLPGVDRLGQMAYRLIARNRSRLCSAACLPRGNRRLPAGVSSRQA